MNICVRSILNVPVEGDVFVSLVDDLDNNSITIASIDCGPRVLAIDRKNVLCIAEPRAWCFLYLQITKLRKINVSDLE
jgi:hypothetical protein